MTRLPGRSPQWNGKTVAAILLDLDGTLLDTVEDISTALNRALADKGFSELKTDQVKDLIGRGAPTLIARAVERLGVAMNAADQAALTENFYFQYERLHVQRESRTRAYPGVAEGLRSLYGLGLSLAVVTNKQRLIALDLLNDLNLSQWIDLVVGGDSCERRKPDPQPLLFACSALHVNPTQTLMVGDSLNDVLAARGAGLPIVCVPYGYNEGHDSRALPCDGFIESLADLPSVLLQTSP